MPDAISDALKRNIALKFARSALRSGSRRELELALSQLPSSGKKADRYRHAIHEALGLLEVPQERGAAERGQVPVVSDGLEYVFTYAEFAAMSFFRASRNGSEIIIAVNSAHPFGAQLLEGERLEDPVVMSMLAAWAHFELDQVSSKRQEIVASVREDWGRLLRRLVRTHRGFGHSKSA